MKRPCSVQNKRQKAHRPESYNGIRGDVECRAAGGQSAQKVPQTLRGYANERLEAQAEHRVDAVVVRHLNGEDLNAQRQKAVNHVQKRGRNDKRSPIGERKRPESHHDQGKRQPEHTVDGVAHRPKPPQQHKGDGGEQPRERGTVVDKRHRRRADGEKPHHSAEKGKGSAVQHAAPETAEPVDIAHPVVSERARRHRRGKVDLAVLREKQYPTGGQKGL